MGERWKERKRMYEIIIYKTSILQHAGIKCIHTARGILPPRGFFRFLSSGKVKIRKTE
jgi:hypothetical protein